MMAAFVGGPDWGLIVLWRREPRRAPANLRPCREPIQHDFIGALLASLPPKGGAR